MGIKKLIALHIFAAVLFSGFAMPGFAVPGESSPSRLDSGTPAVFVLPVDKAGEYELCLKYTVPSDNGITPQALLSLSGESAEITGKIFDLPRAWENDGIKAGERFKRDGQDNEIMPGQRDAGGVQTIYFLLGDSDGGLELKPGEYSLTLTMIRESVLLYSATLAAKHDVPPYARYKADNDAEGRSDSTAVRIKQEAELYYKKSHLEIGLSYDRLSPAVSPNSPTGLRYNILSGAGSEGQWVSWKIIAPKAGYYALDFIYRQDFSGGLPSRRKITIDGETPFEELDLLLFPDTDSFTCLTVGDPDNNPYLLWLSQGEHIIKMETVLTGIRGSLAELNSVIDELNRLYTRIMVVVGETPDSLRDYDLDKNIDGLAEVLRSCRNRLNGLAEKLDGSLEGGGATAARLYEAARMFGTFAGSPRKIPMNIDNFRSQIYTLADIYGNLRAQPLELDYLVVRSPEEQPQSPKAGFWELLYFRAKATLTSFVKDYNTVGISGEGADPLEVWVSANDLAAAGYATGRDQAQIVDRLVMEDFTAARGLPVNVSLINAADTLLPALVSGKGPDTALFVPKTTLANLYYRNALANLWEMTGWDKIEDRFYPSALVSLQTGGKTFALPEIQIYNMLFYRTDIFGQQELSAPETWDDFYSAVRRLQKNGMQTGVSESVKIYEMFLLQNGGTLYSKDESATNMSGIQSVEAFTSWTDLYVKYNLPKSFDPLSRFRSGQMPMLIASLYFYSNLAAGAPEIAGRWKMAQVPGTDLQDGGVSHAQSCDVSGAAVMASSRRREDAFKFLDWWTSDSTQTRFGQESESKMGTSARYFPANRHVLSSVAWTQQELYEIEDQWGEVSDFPQTPAVYYVTRSLTNAFRRVIYEYENPRDVIYRYGRMADSELQRKRAELGLEEDAK